VYAAIGRGADGRTVMDIPAPRRPNSHADPYSTHIPSIK
jgi:hypothetical protein